MIAIYAAIIVANVVTLVVSLDTIRLTCKARRFSREAAALSAAARRARA